MEFNQKVLESFIMDNPNMLKVFLTSVKDCMVGYHNKGGNHDFSEGFDEALRQYDKHLENHVDNYIQLIKEDEEK